MEKIAASVREAGEALSLSRSRIYELLRDGRLHRVKVGRRTLIRVDSIHRLVEDEA